ncbi:Uu.00g059270.m01.CDS01, partial [Anthostomella pinea]
MPFVTKSRPVQTLTATVKDGLEDRPFTIRAEKGLSEWYGLAHFEHPTSAPLSELRQFFPKLDANYVSGPPPPRNGETISQLHHRVAASIQAIITRSDQEGNKAVLVCSHAAVVITLGRVLTGQLPDDPTVEDFKAHTSGLSIYRRQRVDKQNDITATTDGATQGGWTCEANSDCSFLRCGEERG